MATLKKIISLFIVLISALTYTQEEAVAMHLWGLRAENTNHEKLWKMMSANQIQAHYIKVNQLHKIQSIERIFDENDLKQKKHLDRKPVKLMDNGIKKSALAIDFEKQDETTDSTLEGSVSSQLVDPIKQDKSWFAIKRNAPEKSDKQMDANDIKEYVTQQVNPYYDKKLTTIKNNVSWPEYLASFIFGYSNATQNVLNETKYMHTRQVTFITQEWAYQQTQIDILKEESHDGCRLRNVREAETLEERCTLCEDIAAFKEENYTDPYQHIFTNPPPYLNLKNGLYFDYIESKDTKKGLEGAIKRSIEILSLEKKINQDIKDFKPYVETAKKSILKQEESIQKHTNPSEQKTLKKKLVQLRKKFSPIFAHNQDLHNQRAYILAHKTQNLSRHERHLFNYNTQQIPLTLQNE